MFAYLLIGYGLFQFVLGEGLGALWLAFIGCFLLEAAQASHAHVQLQELLKDVRVDVMRPLQQVRAVSSDTRLGDVLEEMTRPDAEEVAVVDGGRLRGVMWRQHVLDYLQRRAELNL